MTKAASPTDRRIVLAGRRALLRACVAGGVAAAFGPGWGASAGDEIRLSPEQIRSLGIQTVALQAEQTGEQQGLPAQVVIPNHQVRIVSAPLAALIEQVLVATQQPVRKGQLLARLQSPGLADVQHTYLQAVTQFDLARANLERDEKLLSAGVIAESRMLATRSHFNEVSADLAERTQALRVVGMSQASLEKLRDGRSVGTTIELFAPIDGVVTEQLAVVGQRVEAAAPLLKVASLEPLWLEVQVPVARLPGVAVGAAVSVAAAEALGKVIAIGRSVAPGTQTVMVRAEVTRGAARLRPGQFVEAGIAAPQAGGQWNLPNSALARHAGRVLVFVQTAAGFRAHAVRVVSEGAERSLVEAGLLEGERVAVKGTASLKAALIGIGVQ